MYKSKNKTGFTPPFPLLKKTHEGRAGFTLVEMLLVTMIISVISLALYGIFSNGIKIWQRVNSPLPAEELDIFFDRFGLDLKNCFKMSGIAFSGTENSLEFAGLVNDQILKVKTVGKIIYTYKPMEKLLKREPRDFSQNYNEKENPQARVLNNIQALNFKYYFYDKDKKLYLWLDDWAKANSLPLAVRLELEMSDGKKTNKFARTVNLPCGG